MSLIPSFLQEYLDELSDYGRRNPFAPFGSAIGNAGEAL